MPFRSLAYINSYLETTRVYFGKPKPGVHARQHPAPLPRPRRPRRTKYSHAPRHTKIPPARLPAAIPRGRPERKPNSFDIQRMARLSRSPFPTNDKSEPRSKAGLVQCKHLTVDGSVPAFHNRIRSSPVKLGRGDVAIRTADVERGNEFREDSVLNSSGKPSRSASAPRQTPTPSASSETTSKAYRGCIYICSSTGARRNRLPDRRHAIGESRLRAVQFSDRGCPQTLQRCLMLGFHRRDCPTRRGSVRRS